MTLPALEETRFVHRSIERADLARQSNRICLEHALGGQVLLTPVSDQRVGGGAGQIRVLLEHHVEVVAEGFCRRRQRLGAARQQVGIRRLLWVRGPLRYSGRREDDRHGNQARQGSGQGSGNECGSHGLCSCDVSCLSGGERDARGVPPGASGAEFASKMCRTAYAGAGKPVGPTPHRPAGYGLRLRVTPDGRRRSLLETGLMSDTTTSIENTDFGPACGRSGSETEYPRRLGCC